MPLYTQDEVQVYTRMLAQAYEFIRDTDPGAILKPRQEATLRQIERTLGWNVPPPMKAKPPLERPGDWRDKFKPDPS